VDGTLGSAICGLHRCFVQPLVTTPKPFFDPEHPQPMVFNNQWQEMLDVEPLRNGYRAGWELFLTHVAEGAPFPSPFLEGAKSVQLAEACYRSDCERRWVDLPAMNLQPLATWRSPTHDHCVVARNFRKQLSAVDGVTNALPSGDDRVSIIGADGPFMVSTDAISV